ncbi:LysR family transcriptional regulator ArgP [soil metagenome]
MEIQQLRALSAVANTGSFEGAAGALHVTSSAISQRIKALETSVGRTLVRRTKPAGLTDSGATILRLARQIETLTADAERELDVVRAATVVPLAINADSLATWVLPALADLSDAISFEIHREDQELSTTLLRDGTVMAAITSSADAVNGCSVSDLGIMRYRPVASFAFAARWFPGGLSLEGLSRAPMVVFDRVDDLQTSYLRLVSSRSLTPPQHFIPASRDFAEAICQGFGWGMLPVQQYESLVAEGQVVILDAERSIDVALYWQQWKLRSGLLDRVAEAILLGGRAALDH